MTDEEAVDIEAVDPSGETIEESTTSRKPIPLRTKGLFGLLAIITFTYGVNAAHVYTLENELRAIAETKESELTSGRIDVETAFLVTATKEYLIYGNVSGKVEVYIRSSRSGGRLTGVDYFFTRDNGEWTETESGVCSEEECQIRGEKAFGK